jgi:uncharacterized protein
MRVVVGTNIFVSSFLGGNPRKIIDLWEKGEITLCLSKDVSPLPIQNSPVNN